MGGKKGVVKNTYKNETNIETFINMVLLGSSVTDIVNAIGFARQTYYQWTEDVDIMSEVDKRRHELHTEGQAFIKAQYKKYIANIDKACNDMTDKRSFLQANIYMVDKMDGKATNNVDVNVTDKVESTTNIDEYFNEVTVIEDITTEDTQE